MRSKKRKKHIPAAVTYLDDGELGATSTRGEVMQKEGRMFVERRHDPKAGADWFAGPAAPPLCTYLHACFLFFKLVCNRL